ncbi:chromosome segregation protein [Planctomycetes bacterium Poly30]|uniref:Chromosome segregation protein n=2 Tax=Saltatorellus ferox TaxID=2528018 RepID=A0A518EU02_9BACT|nr:chromosome segregation protein [Planctomycetes bacterium Poly30]
MRPFGTFTDFELTFGNTSGLHLVFGTNGAGKSTTLEALRSVLYGIAPRKKVHASSDLRIGAALLRSDGLKIEYLRRTSQKTPLWNKADDEPMAIEELTPFLGNLERTRFETLFGLDYETMVAGGSDLLEGKGEIGRALFGAMLGGQRLRHVTGRLEGDLKNLYVDRSPKGRINELVKEHKDLTATLKKTSLRPASHQEGAKKLKAVLAENEADIEARERARARAEELVSLRRSAISLDQLETRRKERLALGDLKPLDAPRVRRVQDLSRESATLEERADERSREISGLEEAIARANALAGPELLAKAAVIEALAQRRGAFREAAAARTKLQRQVSAARAKRLEAQRQAGADHLDEADTDDLRVARPGNASLDELSDAADRLSKELAERTSTRKVAHEAVCRAEPVTQEAAERLERIEDTLSDKLAADLDSLAPFRGTLAELLELQVPAEEEIERREREEREDAAREEGLARDLQRSEADALDARQALERLADSADGPPPTSSELQTAREKRDELIRTVFDSQAREACTALDLQRAVNAADDLVDRRARESARAAEREAQEGALQRANKLCVELRSALDAAREATAAHAKKWNEELALAGLAPMPATRLRSWCARRGAILREAQSIRQAATEALEQARLQEADHRARWRAANDDLEAARAEWTQWALERSLDPGAGPESAQRRLRMLVNVHAAEREITRLEQEMLERSEAAASFERDVAALCEELNVRPSDQVLEAALEAAKAEGTPEGVVLAEARMDRLSRALREAGQAKSELEQLSKNLKAQQDAGAVAAKRLEDLEATLKKMADEASCPTLAALLQLAEQSERARSLDADIRRIESELKAEHGEDVDPATLGESIGERSVDELNEALKEAQAEARALDAVISARAREEGLLRGQVESKGSAEAAHLQARIAQIETELAEATAEFLRAHLADELLRREIERNRQETHGPLLQRAQELFKVLTLGAYEQLHPSESASGKEVMVARRPDGRQVGVDEMSSGTCDQLYLALRIASVEHMLKTVEPMPFIADDLFVNFDDERTEAALRVLAELSKSTQVIVFSHHGSVVETALRLTDEGVPVDVLRLQGEWSRENERTPGS